MIRKYKYSLGQHLKGGQQWGSTNLGGQFAPAPRDSELGVPLKIFD